MDSTHPHPSDTPQGDRESYNRRARVFNAVTQALRDADRFVPLSVREQATDAVLAVRDEELERLREDVAAARKTSDECRNRLEVAERMRPADYYEQLEHIRGSIADERIGHADREHALAAAERTLAAIRAEITPAKLHWLIRFFDLFDGVSKSAGVTPGNDVQADLRAWLCILDDTDADAGDAG